MKGGDRMGHRDDVLMDSQISWKIISRERMTKNESVEWKYYKQRIGN